MGILQKCDISMLGTNLSQCDSVDSSWYIACQACYGSWYITYQIYRSKIMTYYMSTYAFSASGKTNIHPYWPIFSNSILSRKHFITWAIYKKLAGYSYVSLL